MKPLKTKEYKITKKFQKQQKNETPRKLKKKNKIPNQIRKPKKKTQNT